MKETEQDIKLSHFLYQVKCVNYYTKRKINTSTRFLPQAAQPIKKQADSMKQRNETYQVRGYDPALDKQHQLSLLGPTVSLLGKMTKEKRIRLGIFLRIHQLHVKGLTARGVA